MLIYIYLSHIYNVIKNVSAIVGYPLRKIGEVFVSQFPLQIDEFMSARRLSILWRTYVI